MYRIRTGLAWALVVVAGGVCTPSVIRAQQKPTQAARDTAALRRLAEQRLGTGITQAELLDRLRQSGLSRAQVRSRLQQMGYDPGLADRYFDVIERGGEPPQGAATSDFLEALRDIGVAVEPTAYDSIGPGGLALDSLALDSLALDSLALADSLAAARGPQVFGRSLFRRATSQFRPMLTGPVDPDYRLGPGDEVTLILTGDVELAYTLPVNREGYFVIPDVGQVFVNGLTLARLENQLYDRLGRVYSGVRRGSGATTHFQVSLGALRTNQVYLIGEVERPSAYEITAAATVFQALYLAGGPKENGSFRSIEVRRGGRVVQTVDLYDYLLRGDSRADIRLEHGDIIFVPPYQRRVTMQGAVRRPAIYELVEGEDLRDAFRFAGGFDAEAFVQRVQVDRILAPADRRPGIERTLVDVDLNRLADASTGEVEARDGDLVQVFAVSDERRNRVVVTGSVRRPGMYEWAEGMTLWSLIGRAEGLDERAYTPRAHVYRLNEADGSHRLIRNELLLDESGSPRADLVLADRDSVVVFSREELRNPDFATIAGYVKSPGTYPMAEGMTVRDLILAAGGFLEGADTREVEVARLPNLAERRDTTAIIAHVPILPPAGIESDGSREPVAAKAAYPYGSADVHDGRADVPFWRPDSAEYTLQHGDRVFVRRAPGYELPRLATITGEVLYPGTFVLGNRQERISSLIVRAGGLTAEAYAAGLTLYRGGQLVATDLARAMQSPDSRYNLVLQPGDSLYVPEYDPTVLVTGAVTFASRVLYEPGKNLDYYINRSGGYTDLADKGRITVTYQDGERAAVDRKLIFFRSKPRIQPGSSIFVPAKPAAARQGINWGDVLTRTTAILGTVATVIIAVDRVNNP